MPNHARPIGIFDSGVGGLSVLRHIQRYLPDEDLLYFADAGFAPYGEKLHDFVAKRTLNVARFLIERNCKALVIACNTATAAAIHLLRDQHPETPIIGVEPGLKPATAITKSKAVGVLATESTLKSEKFRLLRNQLANSTGVRFVEQACAGLAEQIENGNFHSTNTHSLLMRYIAPLVEQDVDTIVLGCTHYPFLNEQINDAAQKAGASKPIQIIDTGEPVAAQLMRKLNVSAASKSSTAANDPNSQLTAYTTGSADMLSSTFQSFLGLQPAIHQIVL